jgi:hypothetical protein
MVTFAPQLQNQAAVNLNGGHMKLKRLILAVLVGGGVFVSCASAAYAVPPDPIVHASEYFPPDPIDGY